MIDLRRTDEIPVNLKIGPKRVQSPANGNKFFRTIYTKISRANLDREQFLIFVLKMCIALSGLNILDFPQAS